MSAETWLVAGGVVLIMAIVVWGSLRSASNADDAMRRD